MSGLAAPMAGENCRAELFAEQHRDALRDACAEDGEIWQLYANDFGPGGFDTSIDLYRSSSRNRTFVLFDGGELAGMSSFLGIDEDRGVLEIGGTYYLPKLRGTGFNRRVKDMMLERAFSSGIRRVEFRVDRRNLRSQAAMKKLGAVREGVMRVDRRNLRSQAAMKKLGAVREGVMRADRITWTGHVRDTVLFAILKEEWPT